MGFISEQCVLCERLGELFNKRHRVWFFLFPPATNKPMFVYSRQAAGRERLIRSQEGFPALFSVCWWRPDHCVCCAHDIRTPLIITHQWVFSFSPTAVLHCIQHRRQCFWGFQNQRVVNEICTVCATVLIIPYVIIKVTMPKHQFQASEKLK